jgi:hypothetical protein
MRREYVVGVHHNHPCVGREVATPRVILLAVSDHEAAAMDVDMYRGLVVLRGRVIDGGWGGAYRVGIEMVLVRPTISGKRTPRLGAGLTTAANRRATESAPKCDRVGHNLLLSAPRQASPGHAKPRLDSGPSRAAQLKSPAANVKTRSAPCERYLNYLTQKKVTLQSRIELRPH